MIIINYLNGLNEWVKIAPLSEDNNQTALQYYSCSKLWAAEKLHTNADS